MAGAPPAEPGEAFEPIVVNRPGRRLTSPFRVVAINAKGCADPEAVAQRLRHPQLAGAAIILVSESDWGLSRSQGRQSARELAELLGMSFAFSPEFAFRRHHNEFTAMFGNVILTAVPLEKVQAVALPMFYDYTRRRRWRVPAGTVKVGKRAAVFAEIKLAGRAVIVALAHLENRVAPAGRTPQMARLLSVVPPDVPALLGGDFNTTTLNVLDRRECAGVLARLALEPLRLRRPQRYEPLFEEIERAGFDWEQSNLELAPTYTPIGLIPRFLRPKLDWICLRKLKAVPGSAGVVPARNGLRRFSDHDFVVCEFTF